MPWNLLICLYPYHYFLYSYTWKNWFILFLILIPQPLLSIPSCSLFLWNLFTFTLLLPNSQHPSFFPTTVKHAIESFIETKISHLHHLSVSASSSSFHFQINLLKQTPHTFCLHSITSLTLKSTPDWLVPSLLLKDFHAKVSGDHHQKPFGLFSSLSHQ